MAQTLADYVLETVSLKLSSGNVSAVRSGFRDILKDDHNDYRLCKYLAGQIPYYYREPDKIAGDFAARHHAIESIISILHKLPDSEKFQNSHCGEILCATYLTDVLGLKRLYSKLTLISAENTNVHKMDALFVDTSKHKYEYFFVEAKCSILPTETTKTKSHRSGILKDMINSLEGYSKSDKHFDFTAARDNLESCFTEIEKIEIRKDLIPPGPQIHYLGMAAINNVTINQEDDDYILSSQCTKNFEFRALVVSDLKQLANESYGICLAIKKAATGGG